MAVLCPIHKAPFKPIEVRYVGVYAGFRRVLRAVMEVWKASCSEAGCTEVVFYDGFGVVIDGVKDFPKDSKQNPEEVK